METLTVREFREVLKVTGYTQAQFSRFIRMSTSFVSNMLSYYRTEVPLRYVNALKAMLGENMFAIALEKAKARINESDSRK
ncbi:MAG: hypothetical protein HYX66_00775 [Ignavibacteria bacterium]|nr:hypothetical protein [Ignavibacteria bacterium]